jgi:drug/metabolite transporter (DMT)-like permease
MMSMNTRGLGIFLTCLSFFGFTLMDSMLKWVGMRCPVNQAFFISTFVGAAFLAIYAARKNGLVSLKTSHAKLHILRGILYLAQFGMVIYSLRHMALSNFYALIFAAPMFITVLSAVFLREAAPWQQWMATLTGFIGVLIVLRPDSHFEVVGFAVLAATLIYSADVIFMQIIGRDEPPAVVMLYPMATSLPPALAWLLLQHAPVAISDFAWLTGAGFLMGFSSLLLAVGFRLATTPVAAPFHYTQMIWGIIIGWLVWKDLPDLWSGVGAAIIVGSGLYILHRETREEAIPSHA